MSWPRLSDLTIRIKLFALLLVLLVGPFALYATVILSQVTQELEQLGFRASDQVLAQAESYLESKVDLVKRALDLLTLSSRLRELSAADPEPYLTDPSRWIRDAGSVQQLEDTVGQNNPDLRGFIVYTTRGLGEAAALEEASPFRSLSGPGGQAWLAHLDPTDNRPQWIAPAPSPDGGDPSDLRVFRRIPDDQNLPATVGWVRADLRIRTIEEILNQAQVSDTSGVLLVDSANRLVAASIGARTWGSDRWLPLVQDRTETWTGRPGPSGRSWVKAAAIRSTDWSLVLVLSDHDINAFGDRTRTLLLLVLAVLGPLMVPLALWAASGATKRLDVLLTGVNQLGEGNLAVALPPSGRDEIGQLTARFNGMVSRIRDLATDQYRLGAEVKHRELEVLQAQINPHFLYNALDLISGQAQLAGQPQIAETVSALSRFYRLSLAGGADEVPLSREFDHARSYIGIQNLRFDGAVHLETDLPPDLADVAVLKMLLQPLVENALHHGILEKEGGRGTIGLQARRSGGLLVVTVTDDGVGLENPRPRRSEGGYGIGNIQRRLQLRYGDRASLTYEPNPSGGAIARVLVPLEEP